MGTPHKHAAVIKAWADGAKIQFKDPAATRWLDHPDNPDWSPKVEYRVKKEPQIITTYLYLEGDGKTYFASTVTRPVDGHFPGCPRVKHVATYTYEVPENDE